MINAGCTKIFFMKILYTSDIHSHAGFLESLLSITMSEAPDALIIGGDIIPHHLPNEHRLGLLTSQTIYLQDIFVPAVKRLKQQQHISIYLDLGNDDLAFSRKTLEPYDGDLFHLLHMKSHPLSAAVDVIGYMIVPPTPFQRKDWEKPDSKHSPYAKNNLILTDGYISRNGKLETISLNLQSDDTIETDLIRMGKDIQKPFILVSHSPPYATPLDIIGSGQHVGSISIRKFIEKWSQNGLLIASLHGHIHESPGRSGSISTHIGQVICINPGQDSGENAILRYVLLGLDDNTIPPHVRILSDTKTRFTPVI